MKNLIIFGVKCDLDRFFEIDLYITLNKVQMTMQKSVL